jgi:error-prone DNA polymerase
VERLKGAPYKSIHPLLDEVLTETYGIMVYQEDVSQIAMKLAGFDAAEADTLRKVLSKKSKERLADYRNRFYKGSRRRGVSRRVIDAVWEMIESFGGYSFCKPHSASYALVSYKSAYLKAHYPAEFMSAVISNGGGYYSTFAYISEARRLELQVLGPDVNASDIHYQGNDRTLRVGLMQLQGISREILETIVKERNQNGPFRSLDEWRRPG